MESNNTNMVVKTASLEEIRHCIESIDFSNIINKMVKRHGWLQSEAEKLAQLYRNYLFLTYKYGSKYELAPSEEIDEFWHNHILDTKSYRQDCQAIFGEYVDHYPYFGCDEKTNFSDLEKAFEVTRKLHRDEFGYDIYVVRSVFSPLIARLKLLLTPKPKAAD